MTGEGYEAGKIKVVWIETDPKKIYSKMFDEIEQALAFTKSKTDYLVFKLDRQEKMEKFEWSILPYGRYQEYDMAIKLYQKFGTGVIKALGQFA